MKRLISIMALASIIANPLEIFAMQYMGGYFTEKVPDFHREMYADLANHDIERLLIEAGRGSAKSTIASVIYPLYEICEGDYSEIQSFSQSGGTAGLSTKWMKKIKAELENNLPLIADYGIKRGSDWTQDHIQVIRTGYLISEEMPQAKQSVRFGKGRAFPDKKKVAYMKALAKEFRAGHPSKIVLRGKIRLTVLYCFPFTIAEGALAKLGWALTDKHIDIDNLSKPIFDSLKKLIYLDDHQVVEVRARKIRYNRGMIAIRFDEIRPNRAIG